MRAENNKWIHWASQEPDELDQLFADLEAGEEVETPPAPDGAPPAPPAPAPTVDETIAELEGESGEPAPTPPAPAPHQPTPDAGLTDLVRQLAERTIREEQRAEMERRAAEAAARATAEEPAPLFDPAQLDLTPEERETYQASMPVIEKLVRRELMAYHDRTRPVGAQTFEELRQQVSGFQPQLEQSTEAAFTAAMRAGVPDLDARVAHPGWQAYLDQPVPYQGGVTFRQALHNAATVERNLPKALEIIRGFQHEAPATPAAPRQPASPGVARGGAPASVAASVRQGGSTEKKLKYSTFTKASEMMAAGKLDPQKYQAIVDKFMDADEAGLVDYTS